MRDLTWNQRRALENLARYPDGATPRMLADQAWHGKSYLCGSAARSAVMALCAKGLAEVSYGGSPMRYRLTPAGLALSTGGSDAG